MKYFKREIKDLRELKREYYRLARLYHSDFGGSDEIMKVINNEYEMLFELLKNVKTTETKAEFPDVIQKIINIKGIEIEICGDWVWVGGNTYTVKEELKLAGFKYAPKKKMWYWKSYVYVKKSKKYLEMNEIRKLYGSRQIKGKEDEKEAVLLK